MKSAGNKALACVSIMLASAALLPMTGEARAQTVFTTIQAFGDSYADTGNLIKIIGPITIAGINIYPTGRFSGGTNFVDTTSALLGIPQNNFAVGGAQTAAGPIPNSGFIQQAQGFVASGRTIAPSDLVEINIGGNDARGYYQGGGTLAGVPVAAATSA